MMLIFLPFAKEFLILGTGLLLMFVTRKLSKRAQKFAIYMDIDTLFYNDNPILIQEGSYPLPARYNELVLGGLEGKSKILGADILDIADMKVDGQVWNGYFLKSDLFYNAVFERIARDMLITKGKLNRTYLTMDGKLQKLPKKVSIYNISQVRILKLDENDKVSILPSSFDLFLEKLIFCGKSSIINWYFYSAQGTFLNVDFDGTGA